MPNLIEPGVSIPVEHSVQRMEISNQDWALTYFWILESIGLNAMHVIFTKTSPGPGFGVSALSSPTLALAAGIHAATFAMIGDFSRILRYSIKFEIPKFGLMLR